VAREELCQAERDMIYAVRDFSRYQQGFAIEVVGRYFELLRGLDQMNNAYGNYRSVMGNLNLLQIQLRHRVCSQLDVDQAQQKVLDAETIWIDNRAAYYAQIDQFKIYLGVDLSLDLGPDRRELENLQKKGMARPTLSLADAIETGLEKRGDFINTRERYEDSNRHVQIALRNFLPSLDASYNVTLADKKLQGMGLDLDQYQHNFGLDLGLPLDWTPRRDHYRLALLAADQAQRDVEQKHDTLIAEVRGNWRELERLSRKYEIAQQSVQLARRRVEGTQLMLASGQTTAREMANVQDEFLDAQNALTTVLVDYTLYRLRFWYSIGRFDITW
jgi:outer membrane protein TolC